MRPLIDRRQVVKGLAYGIPAAGLAACRIDAPAAAGGPLRPREVANLADAQRTVEGAGVRLRRALGSRALPLLDPFLLLDEIHSENPDDELRQAIDDYRSGRLVGGWSTGLTCSAKASARRAT